MKNQALFSSKDKSKKLKCPLLQFLFGASWVKVFWGTNSAIFNFASPLQIGVMQLLKEKFVPQEANPFKSIDLFFKFKGFIVKLTLSVPEMKTAEFVNSVNLDEVAHNEPPHLDLHCLPSSL